MIKSGAANKGMVAKLEACRAALRKGVGDVLIANGREVALDTLAAATGPLAGYAGGAMKKLTLDEIKALESRHVVQTYKRQPVAFVRGSGSRLTTSTDASISTSYRASA